MQFTKKRFLEIILAIGPKCRILLYIEGAVSLDRKSGLTDGKTSRVGDRPQPISQTNILSPVWLSIFVKWLSFLVKKTTLFS
jgi:hypothetical protein